MVTHQGDSLAMFHHSADKPQRLPDLWATVYVIAKEKHPAGGMGINFVVAGIAELQE